MKTLCLVIGVILCHKICAEEECREGQMTKIEEELRTLSKVMADVKTELCEIISYLAQIEGNNIAKANGTDLEERVRILEFQVTKVNDEVNTITDDVSAITAELSDPEEDVETQITVIFSDQVIQDERLFELEQDMDTAVLSLERHDDALESLEEADMATNASIVALEKTVQDMEGLNTTIQSITLSLDELECVVEDQAVNIAALDTRMGRIELNGTISFHAYLGDYDTVPESTVMVFPNVNVNIGNGYDGATGEFTVPPGGDGLYYLYGHFAGDGSSFYRLALRKNGSTLCIAWEDENNGGDNPTSSCGAVTILFEGDVVDIYVRWVSHDTAFYDDALPYNSFTGVQISPL